MSAQFLEPALFLCLLYSLWAYRLVMISLSDSPTAFFHLTNPILHTPWIDKTNIYGNISGDGISCSISRSTSFLGGLEKSCRH